MRKLFFLFWVPFVTLSCSPGDDSKLSISFDNQTAYLLPTKASSCTQILQSVATATKPALDVAERHFLLSNPVLTWSDTSSTAFVAAIKIKMRSTSIKGGEYTCAISGDELASIFSATTTNILWDGTLAAATVSSSTTQPVNKACLYIKCGGVDTLPDKTFTAIANIEVLGYATDVTTHESTPIRALSTITVENSF